MNSVKYLLFYMELLNYLFCDMFGSVLECYELTHISWSSLNPRPYHGLFNRKWQDYVYIQCEYKSTKQKIKHLLREENKVKENKIS